MSGYGFNHEGRTFTADADTPVVSTQAETDARNRETEQQELTWLQTAPEKVFLYVSERQPNDTSIWYGRWRIGTWLGTPLDEHALIGRKVAVGGIAGPHAHKRSVECRIYGTRYVGWYYESAGDYCRLRKAKRQ